jgi:hypothetical protein
MTTNKPIELGRASGETKHHGVGLGDSMIFPHAQEGT